jgi:hypothetical protein
MTSIVPRPNWHETITAGLILFPLLLRQKVSIPALYIFFSSLKRAGFIELSNHGRNEVSKVWEALENLLYSRPNLLYSFASRVLQHLLNR